MPEAPNSDDRRQLEEALGNLPARQREIFILQSVDGMSYAEIAARTGLSLRAVERNLAAAIYKIATQMEGRRLSWWERWF